MWRQILLHKSEIRKEIRSLRRGFSAQFRQTASLAATALFVNSPHFQHSQHIACHLATLEEMDTVPLIEAIWQANKLCYLPVIASATKTLSFALYRPGDDLQLNRYQILEPREEAAVIAARELDLVITPLVAFDEKGNRLGAGGGYYDRTFAFLVGGGETKPLLVGWGYEAQKVGEVPREEFDVGLRGVVTEKEILFP